MWGIVPAAGVGSRMQPLAFSKELLPVGSRREGNAEHPCAVSEYLLERMALAGVDRVCFVVSPTKSDIVEHFGGEHAGVHICYAVQPRPAGLCDAIFRALPLVADEDDVVVGLPDTVWFPRDGLGKLPRGGLSFLLFPVDRPELFDAVDLDPSGAVKEVRVKQPSNDNRWIWGAFRTTGAVLRELWRTWESRDRADPYLGTVVNAWIANGGRAVGVRSGTSYVDVGTVDGWRKAIELLERA